jgi:hypothetical protein
MAHWVLDLGAESVLGMPLHHYLLVREPKVASYSLQVRYVPLWQPEQATLLLPETVSWAGGSCVNQLSIRRTPAWRTALDEVLQVFVAQHRAGFHVQRQLMEALAAKKLKSLEQAREILGKTYARQELAPRYLAKMQAHQAFTAAEQRLVDRVLRQKAMVDRYIDQAALVAYQGINRLWPRIASTSLALYFAVCSAEDSRWAKRAAAAGYDALYSASERAPTKLRVLQHLVDQLG